MLIIKDIHNLRTYIEEFKKSNQIIGFVPTMGSLHGGHEALIDNSKEHNHKTIVSIFVNPKQFNSLQDFKSYPVNKGKDYDFCMKNKVDILFEPRESEIYPDNFITLHNKNYKELLCDIYRPNHFDGVLNIVSELFKIISPNKAYFGLKDYQQFKIIQSLVISDFPHIDLKGIETVRDEHGLAQSSRNQLLSHSGKEIYINFINEILKFIKSLDLDLKITQANDRIRDFIVNKDPSIIKFDYHEFRNKHDLSLDGNIKSSRIFLAFHINNVRLIDNLEIL